MDKYNELLMPGFKVTATGAFNFDKQTLTHGDPNQLRTKDWGRVSPFDSPF